MKFLIGLAFLSSSSIFSAELDTVKVFVATQSYHCELGAALNCKAVNEVQSKVIAMKKSGGQLLIEDKPRGLSAEVVTSLDKTNVVYDTTLCSNEACSIITSNSDSTGRVNQTASGQYNITQKAFDVMAFLITSDVNAAGIENRFLHSINLLK
jgi:hypothetical protein